MMFNRCDYITGGQLVIPTLLLITMCVIGYLIYTRFVRESATDIDQILLNNQWFMLPAIFLIASIPGISAWAIVTYHNFFSCLF